MKTFFITMTLLLTVNLSSNELSWVDEQVEAIKPPRTGMKSRELSILKNPFIFLKRNKTSSTNTTKTASTAKKATPQVTKKKSPLAVSMLMNSSAMINGKWYRVGDKVAGYKVSKIEPKSVLLTKNKKKLLLSTHSKSKNLNFNNK